MGFAPSATIAQGVADVRARDVGCHSVARLRGKDLPPARLPTYGITMDDVWAIDCLEDGPDRAGAAIVEAIGNEWEKKTWTKTLRKGLTTSQVKNCKVFMFTQISLEAELAWRTNTKFGLQL